MPNVSDGSDKFKVWRDDNFIRDLKLSLIVNEFRKSTSIWRLYGQQYFIEALFWLAALADSVVCWATLYYRLFFDQELT